MQFKNVLFLEVRRVPRVKTNMHFSYAESVVFAGDFEHMEEIENKINEDFTLPNTEGQPFRFDCYVTKKLKLIIK